MKSFALAALVIIKKRAKTSKNETKLRKKGHCEQQDKSRCRASKLR